MLVTCLSLLLATTSCNNDELEFNAPQASKQYTKAELIEQALSRMPKTRAGSTPVMMISIKDTVRIRCLASEPMEIYWEDGIDTIPKNTFTEYAHTYDKGKPSHLILISGSTDVIRSLYLNDNALIFLSIASNKILNSLYCSDNHLSEIDIQNSPTLRAFYIENNELSSIELSDFPVLAMFLATNNRLTELDVSSNTQLSSLYVGKNQLTELYLGNNTNLQYLDASSNFITNLDLRQNTNLSNIALSNLPIRELNKVPVDEMDFSVFPNLRQIKIANTPFQVLDLSNNPLITEINISGTAIPQLDVSELHDINRLYATRSKLKSLIWGQNGFEYLTEVRIESTPFENDRVLAFASQLPTRSKEYPGHFYTYSRLIDLIFSNLNPKHWLLNQ